jgi:hypothetical protein
MTLKERIENAPDNARVAILTPNGEDIYPIQELRELLKENPDIGRVVFGMRRGAI